MTLPPIFAVIDDNHGGAAIILECVRDRGEYRIRPRRLFQQDALPSFLIQERDWGPVITDISLVIDSVAAPRLYYGDCRATGAAVYTPYHPLPIPVLAFVDRLRRGSWPMDDNVVEFVAGNRVALDVWHRRWDPRAVWNDLRDGGGARSSRVVAAPTSTNSNSSSSLSSAAVVVAPPPKFVTDLVIADAVARGATCPITMEVIEAGKAAVTPCFHVFEATALAAWVSRCDSNGGRGGGSLCPVCRGGSSGDTNDGNGI
jgi:hypothetical protein